MFPALKQRYCEVIVPELMKRHSYRNTHQVPVIEKVIINSGVSAHKDKAVLEQTAKDISLIVGQKPIVTKARKSVSNFKLREGMPIGVKVTLRSTRMYEFLYRLIAIALPGIRDFRGTTAKFDGSGNYNLGITDHTIFPEISLDTQKHTIGMDIAIVTSGGTDAEGRELLELMGMPFRNGSSANSLKKN